MKDVSLKNVNLVNGFNVGRCVDMVFIDILDGLCVHGIDDGVPFQNTLSTDGWFHSLFGFLEYKCLTMDVHSFGVMPYGMTTRKVGGIGMWRQCQ